ncbi:MAG: hypothetical protein MUC87_06935 [Bacteroidia bacterium]|jgi:hypothetical protein|nr:hypothetical protein [Bacteroidia bacterium]
MLPKFLYWIAFILAGISIVIRIPEVKEKFIIIFPYENAPNWIAITLAFVSIYEFIVNKKLPIDQLKRIKSAVWPKLNVQAERISKELESVGIHECSFNLVKTKSKVCFSKKLSNLFIKKKRIFIQIWGVNSYEQRFNKMSLLSNQGVCGIAYQSGSPCIFDIINHTDIDHLNKEIFKYNDSQINDKVDIKLAISVPIIIYNNKHNKQSHDLVGVLNFESKRITDQQFISNPKNQAIIISIVKKLAKDYSFLIDMNH